MLITFTLIKHSHTSFPNKKYNFINCYLCVLLLSLLFLNIQFQCWFAQGTLRFADEGLKCKKGRKSNRVKTNYTSICNLRTLQYKIQEVSSSQKTAKVSIESRIYRFTANRWKARLEKGAVKSNELTCITFSCFISINNIFIIIIDFSFLLISLWFRRRCVCQQICGKKIPFIYCMFHWPLTVRVPRCLYRSVSYT